MMTKLQYMCQNLIDEGCLAQEEEQDAGVNTPRRQKSVRMSFSLLSDKQTKGVLLNQPIMK